MSEKADVKSSRMQKGRKTINYLQKLKDEGTPIVQMCPGPRDQFWTMAAEMADVDICRLTVPGDGSNPEMQIKLAPYWIKCVRNAAKIIHINFYMQTPTYASKEAAVANGALYMNCGADSLLPMGYHERDAQVYDGQLSGRVRPHWRTVRLADQPSGRL